MGFSWTKKLSSLKIRLAGGSSILRKLASIKEVICPSKGRSLKRFSERWTRSDMGRGRVETLGRVDVGEDGEGGWGSCCQTPPPTPSTQRCRQNIIGSNLEYSALIPIQKWDIKNFNTKWMLSGRALVEFAYILSRDDADHLQDDLMALPVSAPKRKNSCGQTKFLFASFEQQISYLQFIFLFGTENGEGQLNKQPCMIFWSLPFCNTSELFVCVKTIFGKVTSGIQSLQLSQSQYFEMNFCWPNRVF